MDIQPVVPSVSLIVDLTSSSAPAGQSIIRLVERLALPTTWVIAEAKQSKALPLTTSGQFLAAAVQAKSPQRLRTDLSQLQAGVQALTGQSITTVVGDPQQLRSRAALLAGLGVEAVFSKDVASEKPPRQLPCGLWQVDAAAKLPQPRTRWSLFAKRLTVGKLAQRPGAVCKLIAIDAGNLPARDLQVCEGLLTEISNSVKQQQLEILSSSELVSRLADQHEIKPQRSILRRAA